MKLKLLGYFSGFLALAISSTTIADETKIDSLSEEEYIQKLAELGKGNDCILSRKIKNWHDLNKKSLILYAPTDSRPYYVEIDRPSNELKYAHGIGFHGNYHKHLCTSGINTLYIDGERYTVKAIKKLDAETAKQLVTYKKEAKKNKS